MCSCADVHFSIPGKIKKDIYVLLMYLNIIYNMRENFAGKKEIKEILLLA